MTRAEADASLFSMLASESDRDAARRAQSLGTVLALLPVCAVVWGYALSALAELMGAL
jgi:hypothetical protein